MEVKLKEITKTFGSLKAVDRVSLLIEGGEFFTLLGPSGCGKTTLLRVIAGFASPDTGEIYFENQKMNHIPPHKRETGMVFQNYALFPQLDVFDNVAYGLRARKLSKGDIQFRVSEILKNVQLENLAHRFPNQLSGGQQQRVALARALVIRPKVLLMDEPLSNLDAKLRVNMRQEIRRIQKELGITTLYVTHDQEEAMAISDRITIFNAGQTQQTGTPSEIYFRPANRFVAEFTGSSNLLEVNVISYDLETCLLQTEFQGEEIWIKSVDKPEDKVLTVMLRPEWIKIAETGYEDRTNLFHGEVVSSTFVGFMVKYQVKAFRDKLLTIEVQDPRGDEVKREGEKMSFRFDVERPLIIESS
jgi:iron(III) transport system ATP-binding protein